MIAVDIGCKPYGRRPEDDSIGVLRRRYSPSKIYGFDPHPQLTEGEERQGATVVVTRRLAAWTYDGEVGWAANETRSHVDENSAATVPCFDLAAWLLDQILVGVLKLDAEGAEYALIPHLLENGVDHLVGTLLIEWHGDPIDTNGEWEVLPWHG